MGSGQYIHTYIHTYMLIRVPSHGLRGDVLGGQRGTGKDDVIGELGNRGLELEDDVIGGHMRTGKDDVIGGQRETRVLGTRGRRHRVGAAVLVSGLGFIGSVILDMVEYTGHHLEYANLPNSNSQSERELFPNLRHTTTYHFKHWTFNSI